MSTFQEALDTESFLMYAVKNYDNPFIMSNEEFNQDIKTLTYIKRLLSKFVKGDKIKPRLLVNHIVILTNLFGVEAAVRMMFFYMENDAHNSLWTIILYMKMGDLSSFIPEADLESINIDDNMHKLLTQEVS